VKVVMSLEGKSIFQRMSLLLTLCRFPIPVCRRQAMASMSKVNRNGRYYYHTFSKTPQRDRGCLFGRVAVTKYHQPFPS